MVWGFVIYILIIKGIYAHYREIRKYRTVKRRETKLPIISRFRDNTVNIFNAFCIGAVLLMVFLPKFLLRKGPNIHKTEKIV